MIERVEIDSWTGPVPSGLTDRTTDALERGQILLMPQLRFELGQAEKRFLSPEYLSGKSKNISFDPSTGALGGTSSEGEDRAALTALMRRYSIQTKAVVHALFPLYADRISQGRTSFRPAEIAGRSTSWRKDDTRLHVDAFPSRPMHGNRILRVFANVNPTQSREWRAGEGFEYTASQFSPRVRPPLPGTALIMKLVNITKGGRTLYDHYMLGLHDAMKADEQYQTKSRQVQISFPAGAVWACFTDSVAHAAMSGQHAFEQTFYLPVTAMRNPELSPLRVLERLMGKALV
jgi:hypothetical protein